MLAATFRNSTPPSGFMNVFLTKSKAGSTANFIHLNWDGAMLGKPDCCKLTFGLAVGRTVGFVVVGRIDVGLFVLVGLDVGFLVGFDVVGVSVRFTFCARRTD